MPGNRSSNYNVGFKVDPVPYREDVPQGFRTDFPAIKDLRCREVWAYSYRCFGISLHSAFMMVMDNGDVYVAEGGPTKVPIPTRVFKFCARSIFRRFGSSKERFDMGYMMPHIFRAEEMPPHVYSTARGGDLEKEKPGTLHFESVIQGKGLDGITFFSNPGRKLVKTYLFAGDAAQKAYQDILAVTREMASMHLAYEYIPSRADNTTNCHGFTEMVVHRWEKNHLLNAKAVKGFYRFCSWIAMPGAHGHGFDTGIKWLNRLIPDTPSPEKFAHHMAAYAYRGVGEKPDPRDLMPYARMAPGLR